MGIQLGLGEGPIKLVQCPNPAGTIAPASRTLAHTCTLCYELLPKEQRKLSRRYRSKTSREADLELGMAGDLDNQGPRPILHHRSRYSLEDESSQEGPSPIVSQRDQIRIQNRRAMLFSM